MAAQWANHARAMAMRINPSRPSIRPHSLSFSQTHLFGGLLSRCLRAAAAVKTRLLAHIEKKPRAPSADIADTAPDASFLLGAEFAKAYSDQRRTLHQIWAE